MNLTSSDWCSSPFAQKYQNVKANNRLIILESARLWLIMSRNLLSFWISNKLCMVRLVGFLLFWPADELYILQESKIHSILLSCYLRHSAFKSFTIYVVDFSVSWNFNWNRSILWILKAYELFHKALHIPLQKRFASHWLCTLFSSCSTKNRRFCAGMIKSDSF